MYVLERIIIQARSVLIVYLKHEQECLISIFKLEAHPRVLDADIVRTTSTLNGLQNELSFYLNGEKNLKID